ncbi:ABC transporter permease [Meiothermus granaticius]|uniref:2-aminoethylphosphonate ABC transport system, membrane component PhnV n=1 Tax=Meiothermus granaticius NBRC 107808 TaxID=1227551 RepID=A0A399F7G6_9DEIN|nr:ABC transporter permease [Meiothermus granaticius]RIH92614.1 2-aminoethylphosphonate ABC transport system, membrane component PhnV [Meiothermus granaticius NBRC 107808]GEM87968.1 hypothetical protein MGR01S_25930 [Meiothermus granaticius NBRC 107808]
MRIAGPLFGGLAALLLLAPLLALLLRGLAHLAGSFGDWDVALTSLLLAGGGTLLSLLAGLGLAYLSIVGGAGRWLEGLILLSYLVPPFVTGIGLLFTLQTFGLKAYGVPGILLAWLLHYTPLAYLLLKPQLRSVLLLLHAAEVHGVRGIRRLKVLFPPLAPALLVAGGTVYIALLGNFGVPAVLGVPDRVYVLPTLAYARLTSSLSPDPLGQAAALALWLGLLALPALLLGQAPMVEAAAEREREPRLWARGLLLGYGLAALGLSTLGLLREALQNPYSGALEPAFRAAWELPLVRQGLQNSLLLAGVTTVLLVTLALALRPFPGLLRSLRGLLDVYYLLPGTLLGIGLILLLAPTPLYGTPWLLLLAYLLHLSPLALRALESGARVEGLVLAARTHGLAAPRAWLRVGYPPLLAPAFAAGFLIFPLALSELTLSALLYAPGAETLGVAVLSALNGGLYREAAAIGLALMGFSALALLGRR